VLAAAEKVIRGEAGLTVDYVAVVDPRTFGPVAPGYAGPALIVVAARVGSTRLIDNVPVVLAAEPDGPDTEGHSSDAADH
jgi:pantoate--beta-alanine ligase